MASEVTAFPAHSSALSVSDAVPSSRCDIPFIGGPFSTVTVLFELAIFDEEAAKRFPHGLISMCVLDRKPSCRTPVIKRVQRMVSAAVGDDRAYACANCNLRGLDLRDHPARAASVTRLAGHHDHVEVRRGNHGDVPR